jgi:hypothetical protein
MAYQETRSSEPVYGYCHLCGAEGKEVDGRIYCLACYTKPIKEGERITHAEPAYKSHEEAMYHKAMYVYYQNPKWLNKLHNVNERIVTIAYDRYMSKLTGMLINEKFWKELPLDIL